MVLTLTARAQEAASTPHLSTWDHTGRRGAPQLCGGAGGILRFAAPAWRQERALQCSPLACSLGLSCVCVPWPPTLVMLNDSSILEGLPNGTITHFFT